MKYFKLVTALVSLMVAGTSVSHAADLNPLKDDDKLAVFLHTVSSAERAGETVKIRAAICIATNKCKEITITPAIAVGSGASIDFDKKELKQRRSQVFTGADINERLQKLAEEKREVRDPKAQVAIMLVRVDAAGKILEKSDSVYVDFPSRDAKGKSTNQVKLKLRSIEAKLSLVVER